MAKKKKPEMGVIGLGMVGTQVRRWFDGAGFPVHMYDKFKKIGSLEELKGADIIFVCLPTPHAAHSALSVDLGAFEAIVRSFLTPKIFVVKSTIPPGTTAFLQKRFLRHFFFHSPEFLTETTAWRDFSRPVLQLVGVTGKSKRRAKEILSILPRAKTSAIVSSDATEIFKYARNAFFSLKVTFANAVYELCGSLGVPYDDVKNILAHDPWIGQNHLEVLHRGYHGFGGKCLPKDLKTLIKVCQAHKVDPSLFKATDILNDQLLKKQGLGKTLSQFWLQNKNTGRNST